MNLVESLYSKPYLEPAKFVILRNFWTKFCRKFDPNLVSVGKLEIEIYSNLVKLNWKDWPKFAKIVKFAVLGLRIQNLDLS